jgi:hypothetical protein
MKILLLFALSFGLYLHLNYLSSKVFTLKYRSYIKANLMSTLKCSLASKNYFKTGFYAFWMDLVLLLGGDVERNPDPSKNDFCPVCQKFSSKHDIQCSFCDKHLHQSCADLTDAELQMFIDSARLFFCSTCGPTARRYLKLEKRVELCETKIIDMDRRLANVETKLEHSLPVSSMGDKKPIIDCARRLRTGIEKTQCLIIWNE